MVHEFDGKKYEQASTHQKEWGAKLINEIELRGNERILDLGCGDGTLTTQLAKLVPKGEVVGIDSSQGMIEVAQNKQCANLRFLKKDINDLDFVEEFNVVYSNATLHWIDNHHRLLRNVYHALRENGILRFNFAGDGNCSHFNNIVKESMVLGDFSKYFLNFKWPWFMPPVEEYKKLVEEIGFRETRVWGENADRYFPNRDAMIRWIDQPSLVPILNYVDDKDKTAFREQVVKRMIEETEQKDGRCFETFRRINVFARK